MAMTAAAILSPMLLLPAGGQEQEHQEQTQVSQMTLIARERYPQQLHREMMINQVLENICIWPNPRWWGRPWYTKGWCWKPSWRRSTRTWCKCGTNCWRLPAWQKRSIIIGTKKKQTKTFSLLFSFFYRYTYLSWVNPDRYITLATIPLFVLIQ